MASFGNLLLGLAAAAAIVSIVSLVFGEMGRQGELEAVTNTGYLATFAVLFATTLATGILLYGFLANNFSLEYVVYNHPNIVSPWAWLYRISGVWAGREGSLLFWEWLISVFAAYVAYKRLAVTDKLSNVALAITNFVQVFFLVALFIQTNNPFKAAGPQLVDPATGKLLVAASMNPLLQTWAMVVHPPTLFIGYAGLTIPFAYAIASLIVNDGSKKWVELSDRITVFSWVILGVGIGMGAVWAYIELAFGGYWAWDPVENASLLPWLTGVALIHSMTVYRKRDSFKSWAIMMSSVTFVVVLLGTFITRSGIVQSVHAFEKDPLSFWLFMTMMVGSLAAAAVGLLYRREEFSASTEFESLASKEASYYFNNVLMLVATVLVAYWTLAPALPKWLPGGGLTFGAPTFDAIARPVGILYVAIMGICPILSWGLTDSQTFWKRAKLPLTVTGVVSLLFLMMYYLFLFPNFAASTAALGGVANPFFGAVQLEGIIGLVVAALAISLPLYLFWDGARKRAAARDEGFGTALLNIITKARTQSGGYIVHLGIGIILLGLIGSTMFTRDFKLTAPGQPGSEVTAGKYSLRLVELKTVTEPNNDDVTYALFSVTSKGRPVGEVKPRLVYPALYKSQGVPQAQATQRKVSLLINPAQDIFVTLEGVNSDKSVSIQVKFFPLISWVWVGFVLITAGSLLAAWPRRAREA